MFRGRSFARGSDRGRGVHRFSSTQGWMNNGNCFSCGKPGYLVRHCPDPPRGGGYRGRGRGRGASFEHVSQWQSQPLPANHNNQAQHSGNQAMKSNSTVMLADVPAPAPPLPGPRTFFDPSKTFGQYARSHCRANVARFRVKLSSKIPWRKRK